MQRSLLTEFHGLDANQVHELSLADTKILFPGVRIAISGFSNSRSFHKLVAKGQNFEDFRNFSDTTHMMNLQWLQNLTKGEFSCLLDYLINHPLE